MKILSVLLLVLFIGCETESGETVETSEKVQPRTDGIVEVEEDFVSDYLESTDYVIDCEDGFGFDIEVEEDNDNVIVGVLEYGTSDCSDSYTYSQESYTYQEFHDENEIIHIEGLVYEINGVEVEGRLLD